jgi:ribosomal protein S18 acetylase RimI-like enzyme
MQFERVDPASVVEEASVVLREAWTAPVLHYTPDYLRWQLGFPGAPGQCVLARDGGEPAGFIGLAPRRFRFRGAETDGYVLSFVAVRPAYRRRGLAGELYAELLSGLRASGLPSAVFVEAQSQAARRVLLKAVERLGFKLKGLGQYVNYGFMARPKAALPAASVVESGSLEEAQRAIASCSAEGTLWSAPDRAQIEHALRDPRPRKLLLIQDGGSTVGAATVFLSEIVTSKGFDQVSTLDTVFLPEPTSDRMAALGRAAAAAFAGRATSPVVSAPSLATVAPDVLKAAGFMRTGAAYDGFVLHGEGHPCLEAEVTNLEVV